MVFDVGVGVAENKHNVVFFDGVGNLLPYPYLLECIFMDLPQVVESVRGVVLPEGHLAPGEAYAGAVDHHPDEDGALGGQVLVVARFELDLGQFDVADSLPVGVECIDDEDVVVGDLP